ncbi:hypothetical protein ACFVU3_10195 [Streptomyces sp. NPDC058052]|uniref:hypothetical protein n=1 Tax=Streptomyces sp. NPDC058052 TaxID=3346316 RepID=UPI0036EEF747
MSQNEHHDPEAGFAGELGSALRSTGESFALDGRTELVSGGLARGRRRLLRRRLAVTGGALALAAVGVGGVYAGTVVTPAGAPDKASVAAPQKTSPSPTAEQSGEPASDSLKPGEAEIPLSEIADVIRANTPAGQWRFNDESGVGQAISGIYDDGEGEAAVGVSLSRAGRAPDAGVDMVTCPERAYVPHDGCDTGRLSDGSRWMVFQGYEYPDKREETKNWRAVLLTGDGFLVDASEYNAPAEKGGPITRDNPPLTAAQLKALVTAEAWRPLLERIPPLPTAPARPGKAAPPGQAGQPGTPGKVRKAPPQIAGDGVSATLRALLPKGLRVTDKGGEGEFAFVVVDDGKGKSLVQVNVQYGMGGVADQLFRSGDVTTLPDGRKVKLTRQPGEKGGEGVVWWTADTLTKSGFRVVVSAFNTGAQHEAATRAEPALTLEQLKTIALDPKWAKIPAK